MKAGEKFLAALLFLIAAVWSAPAQESGKKNVVQLHLTVVDAAGSPLKNVNVTVSEGERHYITDASGVLEFLTSPSNKIAFEKDGYVPLVLFADLLASSSTVQLEKELVFGGVSDRRELPYDIQYTRRESVGSAVTVMGEELQKYSTTDWRNALCAIVPGLDVVENYGGSAVSGFNGGQVSVGMRGMSPQWIVDGVRVVIKEFALDAEQIESVTVYRDPVDLAVFGATGSPGVISVKTKRGKYNDRYFNVNYEGGVNTVDVFPDYVSGEDYASMNNRARLNTGYSALYSDETIHAYAARNPYSLKYPNVDWRQLLLKNTMSYNKANIMAAGGNDRTKYSAYMGYIGADDIYKVSNPNGNDDYNKVNVSANLNVRLNDYVDVAAGMMAYLSINRQPSYGGGGTSGSVFESLIQNINSMPPVAFPIYASNDPSLTQPWYAVSAAYRDNPYAEIVGGGHFTERILMGAMNAAVNMDLRFITKGLKAKTYAWFNTQNLVRLGTSEDYNAYIISGFDNYGDAILNESSSHKLVMSEQLSKIFNNYEDRFHISQSIVWDRSFGQHKVSAVANAMVTKSIRRGYVENMREANFGLWGRYSFKDRYLAQVSFNHHGTYYISNSNRWAPSAALGLGWIVSNEPFMKNAAFVDFLKLRAQAGLIHYDVQGTSWGDVNNFSYSAQSGIFGPNSTTPQWFGSTTAKEPLTSLSTLANPDLRMERIWSLNAGLDASMFGSRFNLSLDYYNSLRDGILTRMSNVIPSVYGYGSATYYQNYNCIRGYGAEISADWKDRIGSFSYSLGGWLALPRTKILEYDELHYKEEYRSRIGKSASAIWGYYCDGVFDTDEEAAAASQIFDLKLHARDLKLRDYNKDGVVDDDDISVIGDSSPKLLGGIRIGAAWKGLDLTLVGNFRAFYDINLLSSSYFAGGWGSDRYSRYMLDKLDDANHPGISYNKVNNNYQNSTFWLVDGSFFKLQTVELGYALPLSWLGVRWLRSARIYVRANNVFTLSGVKYVDPESINSGITNYPLMKTYVAGIKILL